MNKKYSTPADMNKFYAQCNLQLHIGFYNDHNRLIANQIAEINLELSDPSLNSKRKRDLEFIKAGYLTWYRNRMIINCFLTMYSHFEECLAVTYRLSPKKRPHSHRSGLIRFNELFEEEYMLKLSGGPQWEFLRDCEKARDIILHAAGNISLARNRKEAEDLPKRNPTLFAIENSRIVLKEELLTRFAKAIPEFIDWLTDQIARSKNMESGVP